MYVKLKICHLQVRRKIKTKPHNVKYKYIAVLVILTNDMNQPTDSDLVFEVVHLLSQFLHFTHGDGCWSLSPVETGRVYCPEMKRKKKGRE